MSIPHSDQSLTGLALNLFMDIAVGFMALTFTTKPGSLAYGFFLSIVFLSLIANLRQTNGFGLDCRCIRFEDTYHKEFGIFTSPNWPSTYDEDIGCLLYSFRGKEDQIVQLSFSDFDLGSSTTANSEDCSESDFVKLYLEVGTYVDDSPEVSHTLCGKTLSNHSQQQNVYYSKGPLLLLEFHSNSRPSNSSGFRGTYRFVKRTIFEPDGELLSGTICDYQFLSITNRGRTAGKFFSPNYPRHYPGYTECAYHFMGKYNEKIQIVLQKIDLGNKDGSCLDSKDSILVYDGRDNQSPLIAHLCNDNKFVAVVSTGPDLFIKFVSGLEKVHSKPTGFQASYEFQLALVRSDATPVVVDDPLTSTTTLASVQVIRTGLDEDELSKDETTASLKVTTCNEFFSSEITKNGSLSSPNFPEPYPADVHCVYEFQGSGKERVQVLFTEFNLYAPHDELINKECEDVDTVMVFIKIMGNKERIDNYCGNQLPSQLMSNGPSMTVEFHSVQSYSKAKGFSAIYRFVSDFGISAGIQDEKRGVCAFLYNSTTHQNGTFNSPNWPGLYPRDTECHYFFYGQVNERIVITFAYFDVEGVPPCIADTDSDYVEFSNFQTVDRKMPRHCGVKKPRIVTSDREFFRVIFKSNDRFDGTGFEAFYQFRNTSNDENSRAKRLSSFCWNPRPSAIVYFVVIVICHFLFRG